MSKTEFNEVCMTHYRDEEKGEDCFALSHTVDNKDWKNFATRVENALKMNHAGGLHRSTRIWKCKFMDDDRALMACESVMEVCSDYDVYGFKSDFFDISYDEEPRECREKTKSVDEVEYSAEALAGIMKDRWIKLKYELQELSHKFGDIQKQIKVRVDEMEVLSVSLDHYKPEGNWGKEVNKWRKK